MSRYPLVEPGTDKVLGYIHMKDMMAALASGNEPRRMRELAREPIYCSEETPSEWLHREFQRRRVHMSIVLGAGNTFVGVVTLEDLLEEFVGEIQDEQDVGEIQPIVHGTEGRFEVDGRLTLDVAERELGAYNLEARVERRWSGWAPSASTLHRRKRPAPRQTP